MRSLSAQIEEDYNECNRLWKRFKNGPMELIEEENLLRVISWLREEINLFKELKQRGIEGVSWAEIEEIEREIKSKEMIFKMD